MPVEEVSNRYGLRQFIRFPWRVYEQSPLWVPPLVREEAYLLGAKNPFWQHARRALFVFREDQRICGRLACIIDDTYNRIYKARTGWFGFFETMPNPDVARELFERGEAWLRDAGMRHCIGPVNPCLNETGGLLVEGLDQAPLFMMPYNLPQYQACMESLGYRKARDLLAFFGAIPNPPPAKLGRVAQLCKRRNPNLSLRPLNLKQFRQDLEAIQTIYNEAWSHNWGFTPMTAAEVQAMGRRLKPLVVPEFIQLAFDGGRPVAFIMALPDYNPLLKKWNGRMKPWHLLSWFWDVKKLDVARVLTLGVVEGYRRQGIDAALIHAIFKAGIRRGFKSCEYSWVLENNQLTRRVSTLMGGRISKRYRLYAKEI